MDIAYKIDIPIDRYSIIFSIIKVRSASTRDDINTPPPEQEKKWWKWKRKNHKDLLLRYPFANNYYNATSANLLNINNKKKDF